MTCTCGHEMSVEAENREEAVTKMQGMMTEEAIKEHMAANHKEGEAMPTKAMVDADIAEKLQPVA